MYIKNIKLKNFRNYHDLALDFDEKINFIVGNNAQGKTNLIEGIFMSALGKSFRTVRDSELINFDSDFCGDENTFLVFDGIDTVADILSEAGVISSPNFFKFYMHITKPDTTFTKGDYTGVHFAPVSSAYDLCGQTHLFRYVFGANPFQETINAHFPLGSWIYEALQSK